MNRLARIIATLILIGAIQTNVLQASALTKGTAVPLSDVEGADDGPRHPAGLLEQTPTSPSAPSASSNRGPCSDPWWKSYVRPSMPREVIDRRVAWVARCAFERFAPGLLGTAMAVLVRESGGWPWARNPDSDSACHPWPVEGAMGSCSLWQHLARYWPGRVLSFLRRDWWPGVWPHVSINDIRAQAIITAKMMQGQGGACPAWC